MDRKIKFLFTALSAFYFTLEKGFLFLGIKLHKVPCKRDFRCDTMRGSV